VALARSCVLTKLVTEYAISNTRYVSPAFRLILLSSRINDCSSRMAIRLSAQYRSAIIITLEQNCGPRLGIEDGDRSYGCRSNQMLILTNELHEQP